MKMYLIRHGATKGNEEKRYVGETDEPLSDLGREKLRIKTRIYQGIHPDIILVSPMKRCIQTAELLFAGYEYEKVAGFQECRFGKFEYKNYQELNGRLDYQAWIDSGGTKAFPEGESPEAFRIRCQTAFFKEMKKLKEMKVETVVLVVHGGTIMSILDAISSPHQDYFMWQAGNGESFAGQYSVEKQKLRGIEKLESFFWEKDKRK